MLTRRKESDTYLATVRRHRWSQQIAMKVDKMCSIQPALWPSSAEEEDWLHQKAYFQHLHCCLIHFLPCTQYDASYIEETGKKSIHENKWSLKFLKKNLNNLTFPVTVQFNRIYPLLIPADITTCLKISPLTQIALFADIFN